MSSGFLKIILAFFMLGCSCCGKSAHKFTRDSFSNCSNNQGSPTTPCNLDGDTLTVKLTLGGSDFLIRQDTGKTRVSICRGGTLVAEFDSIEPLSSVNPSPYAIEYIQNDSCLLLFTYSGGDGCCYGIAVFRGIAPYFAGFLPTYESIAEVDDVDKDNRGELVVFDYMNYGPISTSDPSPPRVVYVLKNGTLQQGKGRHLRTFYLAEAENYRGGVDALKNGDCGRFNRLSFKMYYRCVENSTERRSIAAADSIAAKIVCLSITDRK